MKKTTPEDCLKLDESSTPPKFRAQFDYSQLDQLSRDEERMLFGDLIDQLLINRNEDLKELARLREIEHDTAAYRGFCPNDGDQLVDWKNHWPMRICEKCQFTYAPE